MTYRFNDFIICFVTSVIIGVITDCLLMCTVRLRADKQFKSQGGNKMKRVGKPWFFVVALLIFALAFTSFFGVYEQNGDLQDTIIRGAKDIRWGTDIQGGVNVIFGPEENIDATDNQIDSAKSILEIRLVSSGVTDYELYADKDNDRLLVSFPWKDNDSQNVAGTIKSLSQSAELLFIGGAPSSIKIEYNEDGTKTVTDGNGDPVDIVIEGKDVEKAESGTIGDKNEIGVSLKLTNKVAEGETQTGAEKFAAGTEKYLNQQISIWMDEECISAPNVNSIIAEGNAQITGNFTAATAKDLADKINAGALPFKLVTIDYSSVDPTLGSDALTAMLLAGIIAFSLICVFMIVYYRLPGFVACICLLGQVAGTIAAVSGYFAAFDSFTLTLPGIAGIILSVGMGVDANIITAERIREELRKGKTLDGAIKAGSANSFSAIFDSNITNIIVSVILMGVFGPPDTVWNTILYPFLWMFGPSTTGAIYSFGYTLLVGVVLNFIMGVAASRIMISSLSGFKFLRSRVIYGDYSEKKKQELAAAKAKEALQN